MIHTSYRAANELDLKAMSRSRGSLMSNLFVVSLPLSALVFAVVYVLSRSIFAAGLISGGLLAASAVSNPLLQRDQEEAEIVQR